jgi:O-methyltransferase involved in polyketide biosynthesis
VAVDVAGLGPVEETMLISLWARARETARPDPLVRDEEAARLVEAIAYDFARFDGAWKTQVGVAVRGRYLDAAVRAFVARHPDALIVNVGAGLDARFRRVDNGRIRWVDLDRPDVIEVRRRCLPPCARNTLLPGSALDPSWIEAVRPANGAPVLVVAEGVLMFLDRDRVARAVAAIARAFPGGEMLFDAVGGLMIRHPWLHDTLPGSRAQFAWGLRGAASLRAWSDDVEVLGLRSMLDECPARWRWMRWLRLVPAMRRQFVVAHLRFVGGLSERGATQTGAPPTAAPPRG